LFCVENYGERVVSCLRRYSHRGTSSSGHVTNNSSSVAEKYKSLSGWVTLHRDQLKIFNDDPSKSKLSAERRQRLLDIGVVSDIASVRWEDKFDMLRQFKEEHGHCKYTGGVRLRIYLGGAYLTHVCCYTIISQCLFIRTPGCRRSTRHWCHGSKHNGVD
jgi:hypothetical protein